MQRQLVLACGNTLRGDDGVGWKIAEALESDPALSAVRIRIAQQWTPEMAEEISECDVVVFVDCSAISEPGAVSVIPVEAAHSSVGSLTHNVTPGSLLAMSMELYGRIPERAVAVTVGGKSFELVEGLTEAVEAAIPRAVAAIKQLLTQG
jgi:hydrogenase maturation protease